MSIISALDKSELLTCPLHVLKAGFATRTFSFLDLALL